MPGVEYSLSRGAWEQGGPWNPPTPLPVLIDTASSGSFFQGLSWVDSAQCGVGVMGSLSFCWGLGFPRVWEGHESGRPAQALA